MAAGNSYPAVALDQDGRVVDSQTVIQFTDAADQPSRSGGGSQVVFTAKVSLSSAQLLALFSSPVTLVAAPGAGKAIQVLGVFGAFTAGGTPYVDDDGEAIGYASDLSDPLAESPWDLTNPSSNGGPTIPKADQTQDPSVWENAAVVIACPTTDPTEGDGTAKIVVTYTVIDIT